jgi:hypothetical protein
MKSFDYAMLSLDLNEPETETQKEPVMNELIQITAQPINGQTVQTVNARDLHTFLGMSRDFNQWMREQIDRARMKEGRDYVSYEDVYGELVFMRSKVQKKMA